MCFVIITQPKQDTCLRRICFSTMVGIVSRLEVTYSTDGVQAGYTQNYPCVQVA